MNKEKKIVRLKLNRDLRGHLAGTIIKIGLGFHKMDNYWAHKIKDMHIDGAVTLLEQKEEPSSSSKHKAKGSHSQSSSSKKPNLTQARENHVNK